MTPLFRARTYETIKLLLSFGADPAYKASKKIAKKSTNNANNDAADIELQDSMLPSDISSNDKKEISAVEYLMQFHPDCPKAILDEFLSNQDDDLIMDFRVFEGNINEDKNEMSVFMAAEENHRKDLLLHPLMQIFLSLKWDTVKILFWIKLFFQISLVAILTYIGVSYVDTTHCNEFSNNPNCFISTHKNDFIICNSDAMNDSILFRKSTCDETIGKNDNTCKYLNMSYDEDVNKCCFINGTKVTLVKTVKMTCLKHRFDSDQKVNESGKIENVTKLSYIYGILELQVKLQVWSAGIITLITLVFIKEFTELTMNGFRGLRIYFKSLQNWIQCLLIVFSTIFYFKYETDLDISNHAAAWMIFLAWIDLTLYVAKVDIIGEYIYMTVIVCKTIFWCLLIYIPSYMAFTFGFYILLKSNPAVQSYTATFIKVLAMKAGELDYKDDFDYHQIEENGGSNISVQIMFVFFLICISLIVMNLLLAVTVNKTENLVIESKKMRAVERINNVDNVNNMNNKKLKLLDSCFSNLNQPILPRCMKDKNYFVSIKSINEHQNSKINKFRRFFKLDSLREVYKFEDGKENLEPTGMQISDTLFKETMEFVMNKHLKDMDFLKEVSNIRENSKNQLQAILQQNDNEETVGQRLAELTQTVSEQNKTIRDLLLRLTPQ